MTRTTIDRGWLHWTHGPQTSGRPKVLLECPDDLEPAGTAHELADAGCDVTVCRGPDSQHECPLLEHGLCPLAEDADVVINCLSPSLPENDELVAALRARRPSVPVVVVASSACGQIDAFGMLRRAPLSITDLSDRPVAMG